MKIIFDSEEQRHILLNDLGNRLTICPSELGLKEHCGMAGCTECWEMAINCEVIADN